MATRRPPVPRLDEGAKSYYRRVEDYLDGDEEGDGEIFLQNVVDQVIADGVRLVSCDKDGSRALERLLQHFSSSKEAIKKLMTAVQPEFFKLCLNRCGSHVMETLLHTAGHTLSGDIRDEDEEFLETFLALVSIMDEKVSDCISHQYGSHVLGGMIQELAGVRLADQMGRSRYSLEFRKAKMKTGGAMKTSSSKIRGVSAPFLKCLERVVQKISKLDNLKGLLTHQSGSPVIQCLLRVLALRLPERGGKLIKKILKLTEVLGRDEEGHEVLPDIFTDLVGSHLMETMVEVASPDVRQVLFDKCFRGRIMSTALHPVANFPLQQLIGSSSPELLTEIVPEVKSLEEVLFVGHTGVVVKLMEAAISCTEIQPPLLNALLSAFHIHSSHFDSCAPVILALMTYEVFYPSPPGEGEDKDKDKDTEDGGLDHPHPISLHGSLILQALLRFEDTRRVARSLLRMSVEELVRAGCDAQGSHVLTAFLSSPTVSVKRKDKLMKKLVSNLLILCLSKHGSRVVDTLWQVSEVSKKEELAKVLLAHEEELSADFYGSIVLRNCNIAHFRKRQEGWLESQRAASKKRELFQDLLGDVDTVSSEARNKRKCTSDGDIGKFKNTN